MSSFAKCIFYISYNLKLTGMLWMFLFVPFLITPRISTITDTMVDL